MNITGAIRVNGGRGPFDVRLIDSNIPEGTYLEVTGDDGRDIVFAGDNVPSDAVYTYTIEVTDAATGRTATREQVTAVGAPAIPYKNVLAGIGANIYVPMDEVSGSSFLDAIGSRTSSGHSGITLAHPAQFSATAYSAGFSGSGSGATFMSDSSWNVHVFSAGCFLKTTAGAGAKVMVARDLSNRQFWLYHDGSSFLALVLTGAGVRSKEFISSGINDGNPHLAVMAYDNTDVHLWLDGAKVGVSSYGTPSNTGATGSIPLTIGNRNSGNYFTGDISGVFFIPGHVVSDAEVAALWAARNTP